ncbi:MAG: galactosyldiacylglycerol synthase [Oscillospiraceae bacterium]|nr:galactosyldiacylglycerol synthase [Oscillospiraceae bacterium]
MKVLILTLTAGNGHILPAKAMNAYFENIGINSTVLDTYYYINKLLGDTINKGYLFTIKRAKPAYKRAYRQLEKRRNNSYTISATRFTNLILAQKLRKFMDVYNPDVIVCTHIFAGIIVDVMKQLKEISAKTVGILTDYTIHPYWEEALRFDYFVVPNEYITLKAKKKGFDNHQILPLGIPIHPKFNSEIDKVEMRKELGLDINKKTVLLMSGSMGHGHIEKIVKELDDAEIDMQVISVCGNNKRAKEKIDSIQFRKTILNFGYSNEIEKLMSAADCIITKPGGATTSEALAKRLPIIICNPIPGQEDRNTEFLLNNGAAMSVTKTFPLDEILNQLFDNPNRLDIMRQSIETIRKPNSTADICEFVKGLK